MKKFRLCLLVIGTILGLVNGDLCRGDTWETKAQIPEGRIESAGAAAGGRFYVFGGSRVHGVVTGVTEVYDPTTDAWSWKAEDLIPTGMSAAGFIDGKIYLVGGWVGTDSSNPTSAVRRYDPVADAWTMAAPMSVARGGTAAGVINGKLYVTGGMGGGTWFTQTEIYDPVADVRSSGAPLPLPVYAAGSAVLGGKLYVVGGILVNHSALTPALQIYDPATDSWTSGQPMPASRYGAQGAALNGKLYAVCGGADRPLSTVEIYDPSINLWTTGPSAPTARSLGVSCVIDSRFYVTGGYNEFTVAGIPVDGTLNVYTPAIDPVPDTVAPVITCPPNLALACSPDALVPAVFTVNATDNVDPSPVVVCNPPSGSGFPIGSTVVRCVATDYQGNQSFCSFTVAREALVFDGFLLPIGGADANGGSFASPARTFKMGSTIPVKFSASCDGVPVLTGTHTLQAIKFSDATTAGTAIDASPQGCATTGNQFRLADCQWQFNLDTKAAGMSVGIWQLVATLSDGSRHTVRIQIK
jgi:N-acetylneuraminic acid mutarotase